MKNFYLKIKKRTRFIILVGSLLFASGAYAQTTLAPGDIAFTAYDSTPLAGAGDSFSFVLLTNITSGTKISFTDRGYTGSGWQAAASTESSITWTSGTALPVGTEVFIAGLVASTYNPTLSTSTVNGTVALTEGTSTNGLSLSNVGDQIIAFQGGNGSISGSGAYSIAGINYFYTAGSTSAGWNIGVVASPNASLMPPGLTGGTSAFYTGSVTGNTLAQSGKFNCTGTPTITAANVRSVVMNIANWSLSTGSLGQSSGCAFIGSAPVITVSPTNTTVCSGGTATFSITATGATSYQWYQNSGSGFTALSETAPFSGVTTNTLTVTGVTSAMNGYQYRCIATNSSGSTTSTSASLTLTSISGTTVVTNVACNGSSNGSINLTPTGGTAPYTFNWGGGITTEDRTGLAAGTYTVTITDANGCTGTVNATVTQPATAVSGTTVVTNVACNGGLTGAINLTPTGGTAPYTFNWGGGITTEDRTGLAVGLYTVTITDANGCTGTVNATITQPTAISGTRVVINVSCNGGSNGSINLTPTGGTAPYTFNWGGGITTEDRTGLAAGTYTVTITDANGCTGTVNTTVTQPPALSTTLSQTNVSCNGGSSGSALITVSGGTAPYTYSWSPTGGTAATATGLSAGIYTVTVTDANSCTTTRTVTITQPTALSATISQTNVSCNGGSNGSASITVSGGVAPYAYSWSPTGGTAATATGLSAGAYTVTVTDNNFCTITRTVTITQPTAISGTRVVTNVSCNGGSNGSINLTPTGGTAPYTFNWGGGITTEDRTGLTAGTYTVTITDANGCTGTVNATVTQPATAVSGTTVVTNVACNGASNGSINLTPTGGTAPYTFNWGGGITTEDRTGLAAGTYTVTITDANGCTGTVNATVTQPATAVSGTTVVTNVACNGASNGSINLTPTGGTAPYTFNWGSGITTEDRTGLSAGTYTVTITDANGCTGTVNATVTQPATAVSGTTVVTNVACNGSSNGSINLTPTGGTAPYTFNWGGGITTEDRTGLAAGTYTVTITDANGCTGTVNATVTQPTALSATISQTNVSCNGGSNGSASITVSGGTAPYTYSWSPTGGTAATATGLSAGIYTVTVTDANSCITTRTVTITQPTAVSGTTVVTNVACNGASNGAINLTPTGGTAPYTFNWGGGITTEDRTGLSAGTYTVTITDANGCTGTVNATVTQPATAVSGTTVVTNVACNGASNGAINLTPTGGTAPYTFNWGGGITTEDRTGLAAGTYTVTITDANGCTGTVNATVTQPATAVSGTTVVTNVACNGSSNGAINLTPTGGTAPYTFNWGGGITTEDRTGLAAGTYTVTITDANGCTGTVNATVTQPATAVSGTTVVTNVACNGASNGSINLTPTGGTAPYAFNWGGGITTEDRTGLSAGTYTVTITDANGCTGTVNATVTQPATAVSGTTVVTNVACNGSSNGAINLTPTGGTAPYTFNWGGGITTEDRTGLSAGTYTVTITDSNGCTGTVNATVTQPATAVSGTTVVTNVACNGASNGAINLTPTGGTAPYTFNWGGGITTEDRIGLAAGTYTVTITDANGCTGTVNATVTQPTALSATISQTNVSCNGGSNGSASITVSGGTAPYTYSWSPTGGTAATATGLSAGTYTVTVTDANSCTTTRTVTITQPTAVSGTTVVTNVACNGSSNGSINLTPTGGTAPYTFNWGGGITTEDRTGLSAGTYTVIITDANGCTGTVNATVTQPATAVSGTTVVTNVACNGSSNGAINLTPTGGTAPYTFNWGGGITTEDRTGLAAGTYTVTITDANGCTGTVNATVTQPTALSATISQTNVSCNGGSNGSASITVSGGTAPYTYSWSPTGGTAATATGLSAGIYTVTVTDANSCTTTRTVTITQPTAVSGTTVVTNVACNGSSNGAINLTPTGGTAPYTFNWGGGITTEDRTGLAAGTYTVTITDANGCTGTVNATVTQPTALSATISQTNVSCNGGSNGSASITVSGGTAPYTYSWSPTGGTAATATGLSAGIYTVTVTDANSCTTTRTVTITQPTALSATISQTNVSCNGGSNGSASIAVSGGTAPYTYSWSPTGGTGATATGLSAGIYTVTVTDNKGCTITRTVTITQSAVVGAPTGAAIQSFNAGDTLSALVVNGQGIKWYASATDATNHTGSLPMTTPIVNNTTYYATQTSGSCESTASLAVLAYNASLSVGNVITSNSSMQIYPNPVREVLNISGEEKINRVVIFSADGRKVTEKTLQKGERSINVDSLVQGVYLIQVFTKDDVKTFKFIKK